VSQPLLVPLQLELLAAAAFHRCGQDHTVRAGRLDHRLAIPFVDQDPGVTARQLRTGTLEPRVDEPLGGCHRGALPRVWVVVPDTEQGPAERLPVIHRHDQQWVAA